MILYQLNSLKFSKIDKYFPSYIQLLAFKFKSMILNNSQSFSKFNPIKNKFQMAQQVLSILQEKQLKNSFSSSDSDDDSETNSKNSPNKFSQKSLLTEALRASQEQSNNDSFDQEYLNQVLLRPRFQDYSLAENSIIEEELKKFGHRSVKSVGNGKDRILTNFIDETKDENKENNQAKRRKEIRLKRDSAHCSKCEIF